MTVKTQNKKQAPGEPSPAQKEAIEHVSGPVQVLAGPGSGKTYLIIRRICHLICHHGISSDKILVITFTKAAALEMKERFFRLTEGRYPNVNFGTFHAVYFRILKSGKGMENCQLISAKEKRAYLKHSLAVCGIEDIDAEEEEKLFQRISRAKSSNATESEQEAGSNVGQDDFSGIGNETLKKQFPAVFAEYCRLMKENGKLDFDDMILLCHRLLSKNKDMLSYWQSRFSHILADEFQDVSLLQYRILQQLAAPERHLFVVGDDDQSIYGFRGAGPDIMRQFLQDYPDAKLIFLDRNYRCGEKIVQAASLLISDNKNRFTKNLKANKPGGESVKLKCFADWERETDYLLQELKDMSYKELGETAIICRTNVQTLRLSGLLTKNGLPFKLYGKMDNLLEHPVAKDILSYLQFAEDSFGKQQAGGKRSDFLRIINRPCRYIRREAAGNSIVWKQNLLEYYGEIPYMQKKIEIFFAGLNRIAFLRPYLAADYVRNAMGYNSYLEGKREGDGTWMEVADKVQEMMRGFSSLKEWKEYCRSYTGQLNKAADKAEGVSLITMHSAKGLEYKTVFIPDVNRKLIPHNKARNAEQIEEERRLLYVAMTRAKERLEILCSGQPSYFLDQLSLSPYVTAAVSSSDKLV